jgi:hypothetical protein
MILLILYFISQIILVKVKLDYYMWSVGIKRFTIKMLWQCIYLKKEFVKKYLCYFAHGKPYFLYITMLESIVD